MTATISGPVWLATGSLPKGFTYFPTEIPLNLFHLLDSIWSGKIYFRQLTHGLEVASSLCSSPFLRWQCSTSHKSAGWTSSSGEQSTFWEYPFNFFVVIITLHNSCLSTLCSRMCGLLGLFSPTSFIICTLISLNLRILNPISFALLFFLPFVLVFALSSWTTESPPLCSVLEKYNCATIFPCSPMPGVQCTNGLLPPEF